MDVIPKGDMSLLGTSKNQHGETYLIKSQIQHKNRDAQVLFLQHHLCLSDEKDIVQNDTWTNELKIVYNNGCEYGLFKDMTESHCVLYETKRILNEHLGVIREIAALEFRK